MYIAYYKELNTKDIINKTNETINLYQKQLDLINFILPIIKQFEGKKITKIIANKIETELKNQYSVYYDTNYSMYHIRISDNNIKIIDSLIGYFSNPIISYDNVVKYNQCYLLNEGRIKQLKAGLNHIENMVEKWNKNIKELKEINEQAEKFELQYTFDFCNEK